MFGLAANGRSIIQIQDHLRAKYPGKLAFVRSWVLRVLHNPVYTGKISKTTIKPDGYGRVRPLPGEWVDSHEAIISPDLFAIVQKAIERRARGRRPTDQSDTAHYLMRGIAGCAMCNSLISAVRRSGRHRSGYYVCNRRLQPSQATGERCMGASYLRQDITDQMLTTQVKRPGFEKQRADVTRGRDAVLRLVAAGRVTIESATNTLREIDDELATVDAAEAEFKASLTGETVENRRGALAFVEQAADEWDALTIDVRRGVLGILAREITVGNDKRPRIVWKEAGELAVGYAIGALQSLRAPVLKALPAPRERLADLLERGQAGVESLALKAS